MDIFFETERVLARKLEPEDAARLYENLPDLTQRSVMDGSSMEMRHRQEYWKKQDTCLYTKVYVGGTAGGTRKQKNILKKYSPI